MTHFIAVSVDLEAQAGYVRYHALPAGERARSKRISEDVVADYRENGELLGLELLALDGVAMEQARTFAASRNLAFPRDLNGGIDPS